MAAQVPRRGGGGGGVVHLWLLKYHGGRLYIYGCSSTMGGGGGGVVHLWLLKYHGSSFPSVQWPRCVRLVSNWVHKVNLLPTPTVHV